MIRYYNFEGYCMFEGEIEAFNEGNSPLKRSPK